jgi:hypothetical protein
MASSISAVLVSTFPYGSSYASVTATTSSAAFRGGAWSTQRPPTISRDSLLVSCPSTRFCAAVNSIGEAYTHIDGTWSNGVQLPIGTVRLSAASANPSPNPYRLYSVSCSASSFCMAVGQSGIPYAYSHGSWSNGPTLSGGSTALYSVSCPASTFCMAVDGGGEAYAYSRGSWSSRRSVTSSSTDALLAVSCPTTTFCMAVDEGGFAYSYSRGSWSRGRQVTTEASPLFSVSCPSSRFCAASSVERLASGNTDFVYIFNHGEWSSGRQLGKDLVEPDVAPVSCPIVNVCMAVGQSEPGHVPVNYSYTYSGRSWSSGTHMSNYPADSLSCPTTRYCVATGDGTVVTYVNRS